MFRVMLLDDERVQREGMARHVKWAEYGFEPPVLCGNGWDALGLMEADPVDMLLTDIRMPGMDGLAVIKRARALCPDLFIAVVSGYAEFQYAQEAMRHGALEYLLKPVKPEDIHRVLAGFVSSRASASGAQDALNALGPIEEVTGLLKEHLDRGIALHEIAEKVHMNASYLCTLFKKSCGETIFERLARLQKERACMLLATTNLSVADIAEQTGGRTASNFAQWFRKQVGITPLEYRRIVQQGS